MDPHTTCNKEFTERHPVVAEVKDGSRQQRFGAAERILLRSTTRPPFVIKKKDGSIAAVNCRLRDL